MLSIFQKKKDYEVTEVEVQDEEGSSGIEKIYNKNGDDFEESTGVRRGLKTRHITLIALGGIIGPGTIAGLGVILNSGGPATLLIDYALLGTIAFAVMQSVGELSSIFPQTIAQQARRFVDEAFAAAIGYNYLIIWFAVACSEYNTLAATLQFWGPQVPIYGYFLMFWVFFLCLQFIGSSGYGELEYWLAMVKIIGISAFYIFTIVYMSGGIKGTPAFGFRNFDTPWGDHTAIRSLASVFTNVSTAYAGVEMVTVAAAETKNPPKAIPIAIRQTFWRIIYVYMFIVLAYGITCAYNDPAFELSTGALKSPMTVAITNAGWAGSKHLINAFIVICAISAINSCIYIGSRTIVNLAAERMIPFGKFVARTNKRGVPYVAATIFNLLAFVALMDVGTGAAAAYSYIMNISGIPTFIVWAGISYTHLRFRKGWVLSGRSIDELPYKSYLFPWVQYYSIFMNIFLVLVQGWMYLKPFQYKWFIDCYILVPIFPIMFFGYKYFKKTTWVKYEDMDFETGRRKDLEEVMAISKMEKQLEKETKGSLFKKFINFF